MRLQKFEPTWHELLPCNKALKRCSLAVTHTQNKHSFGVILTPLLADAIHPSGHTFDVPTKQQITGGVFNCPSSVFLFDSR